MPLRLIFCFLFLGSLTGCFGPRTDFRSPFEPRNSAAERRSYERYDPYPDESLGPDTMVRPPSFNQQRSEPRRSMEQRIYGNVPYERYPESTYGPAASWDNPNVVRP